MDWKKVKETLKDYYQAGHKRAQFERDLWNWWNNTLTTPQRKFILERYKEFTKTNYRYNRDTFIFEKYNEYKGKEETILGDKI